MAVCTHFSLEAEYSLSPTTCPSRSIAHHHIRAQVTLEDAAGGDPGVLVVIIAACADVSAGGGGQTLCIKLVIHLQDLIAHITITVILDWVT